MLQINRIKTTILEAKTAFSVIFIIAFAIILFSKAV